MEKNYTVLKKNMYFKDIFLLFCGYSENEPFHSYGPGAREEYIIHIVVEGEGKFRLNNTQFSIKKGECFVIFPGQAIYYEADQYNPWSYFWVGFGGRLVEKILNELYVSIETPVFKVENTDILENILNTILFNEFTDFYGEMLIQSNVFLLFSELKKSRITLQKDNLKKQDNLYFFSAMEFIQKHYKEQIKVKDIASFLSIDRTYLTKIFKENSQVTPQAYLTTYRISRAVDLLLSTDHTIEKISQLVGYSNQYVFSKSFKRMKGESPSVFRKEMKRQFEISEKEYQNMYGKKSI